MIIISIVKEAKLLLTKYGPCKIIYIAIELFKSVDFIIFFDPKIIINIIINAITPLKEKYIALFEPNLAPSAIKYWGKPTCAKNSTTPNSPDNDFPNGINSTNKLVKLKFIELDK